MDSAVDQEHDDQVEDVEEVGRNGEDSQEEGQAAQKNVSQRTQLRR